LQVLRPKLASDYHFFLFCHPDYQARIESLLHEEFGDSPTSRIIWGKNNLKGGGRVVSQRFITNWDMVFHYGNHDLNFPQEWGEERFAIQTFPVPQSNFDEGSHHPTPKPVALIKRFVELGSKPGDIVLDCFAGGGTTGQACADIGQRQCILVEKSDKFCQVIEMRLNIKRRAIDA